MTSVPDARRALPAVGVLLDAPEIRALLTPGNRALATRAVREAVAAVRAGDVPVPADSGAWATLVGQRLNRVERTSLRPVLNATGVILHTNLGRAPLAVQALEAIAATAGGACNLEYDVDEGARGSRYVHAVELLRELSGAEDALVLNNGAAALVVALNTMADGREAVLSRGELIEIGGSFRVPDIMAKSGAVLREVGTTNRTHASDYRSAIGERTGAIIKVHRSNFEQRGFVAEASLSALAPIAAQAGVPLLFDFGSGLLMDLTRWGLTGEPTARDALREDATVVVMSGDKLLGGPQAGIMLGRAEWIARCRRNPLTRAFRVDKLTLAALEATLALYRDADIARQEIPVLRMLTADVNKLRTRAESMSAALRASGVVADVVDTEATVGGGAFPTARIPSIALSLPGDAKAIEARLRAGSPAVIGRIESGRLLLDVRSLGLDEDDILQDAVIRSLSRT